RTHQAGTSNGFGIWASSWSTTTQPDATNTSSLPGPTLHRGFGGSDGRVAIGTQVAERYFMPVTESPSSRPISDHFLGDHRRLEIIFEQVLAAVSDDDPQCLSLAWSEFETDLLAHLGAEETYLIP